MTSVVEIEIEGVGRFDASIENLNRAFQEAVNALTDIRIMAGSNPEGVPMMSRDKAEAMILQALRGQ